MDTIKPAYRHSFMILALVIITLIGSLPGLSSVQVIDRDEARYAQASVQMEASGDYVNIRFHDRERHKKPAGIYWLQTLSLKAFSNANSRNIWVHRLPSVLAGLIAVLGLYWAGLTLYDRRGAFIAALLLSISLLFIFESHIAKTDAALCAASVWVMGAILRLRQSRLYEHHGRYSLIFWAALGCAVIIKGPILPAIIIVSLVSVVIWDKIKGQSANWLWPLINPLGIILCGLIFLPWYIMIFKLTDGAFFGAAIGGDLTPKLTGGQEKHGGLPGYYTVAIFATFWPAALFLLSAIAYGIKTARGTLGEGLQTQATPPDARWLLAWIIPFWIILEIIPTKLTHYALPLFPAFALLMSGAILAIDGHSGFKVTRRIGALIFFIITTILVFGIAGANAQYGSDTLWVYILSIIIIAIALFTFTCAFKGKMKTTLIGLVLTGLGLSAPTYGLIMPSLSELRIAPRISETLTAQNIALPRQGGPLIRSPHFTEPSLIYHLGENVLLGAKALNFTTFPLGADHIWIIDKNHSQAKAQLISLDNIAQKNSLCIKQYGTIKGLNYSKGDAVDLQLLTMSACTEQ